jgi:hypothetical protein
MQPRPHQTARLAIVQTTPTQILLAIESITTHRLVTAGRGNKYIHKVCNKVINNYLRIYLANNMQVGIVLHFRKELGRSEAHLIVFTSPSTPVEKWEVSSDPYRESFTLGLCSQSRYQFDPAVRCGLLGLGCWVGLSPLCLQNCQALCEAICQRKANA